MQQVILVPLDGSSLALTAIPYAVSLARTTGRVIMLLQVLKPPVLHGYIEPMAWPAELPAEQCTLWAQEVEAARDYLHHIAQRIDLEGATVWVEVAQGDPATVIINRVQHEPCITMIVMATHARHGVQRWVWGSVAEQVLCSTPVPLLLTHGSTQPGDDLSFHPITYRTILVPLNDTRFAEQVLPVAQALASATNATLCLAGVAPELESLDQAEAGLIPMWMVAERETQRAQLNAYLADKAQALMHAGIRVLTRIVTGTPATGLAEVYHQIDANLIMMATHGWVGLDHWWASSIALKLLHTADIPLLLVRVPQPLRQLEAEGTQLASRQQRLTARYIED